MAECCQNKDHALEALRMRQATVLKTVLVINLIMFGVELKAGLQWQSIALAADSLDMLGDAIAYGTSLWAIGLGPEAKARSAQVKGMIMIFMAVIILGQAVGHMVGEAKPHALFMGGIGTLALVMNLICLGLLTRHRQDDLNMSSIWVCSRNDIIANVSVLAAAVAVAVTGSKWPDLVVGLGLTLLFFKSGRRVLKTARLSLTPM